MQPTDIIPVPQARRLVTRDFVAVGFRHKSLVLGVFLVVIGAALLYLIVMPDYASDFKILVKKERVDPVVTPEQNQGLQYARDIITEEELNSEVELIRGDDLLRKVVLEAGLGQRESNWFVGRLFLAPDAKVEDAKTARAVLRLEKALTVDLLRKSNIIVVTYHASNPKLAADVTSVLARLYLEKHMEVNRLPGQFAFFNTQAENYRHKLAGLETQLIQFPAQSRAISGQMERDIAVQKIGELRSIEQLTYVSLEESKKRIALLESKLSQAQPRITTQIHQADNPQLMQQLKGTLLSLELRRTELLQKYDPSYRSVRDVEEQITTARAAIDAAEKTPMTDAITDMDPTYEWMRSELTKARADLVSLQARATATAQSIASWERKARELNKAAYQQNDLQREAKAIEENYQLYSRKREEARITDALDRSRILNVTLAQTPSTPVLPTKAPLTTLLIGLCMALVLSAGTAYTAEYFDHSFHTPGELSAVLNVPVLAALPAEATLSGLSAFDENRCQPEQNQ